MRATTVINLAMFLANCAAVPVKTACRARRVPDEVIGNVARERHGGHGDGNGDGDGEYSYQGHMTYYHVGLGACGHDDSGKGETHNIVAVSALLMPALGGGDMCGRQIAIKGGNGREVTATIRDKCMSCPRAGIDVSEKVFKELTGDLGLGKTEVSWGFI